MENRPVVNDSDARKKSIIENTPAKFEIEENPNAVGKEPIYEMEVASQVNRWCALIIQIALKHKIDSTLVMAVMYMETTHGWYDEFYPFRKTMLPMNIHYRYWKEIGVTKELLKCPFYNIEFGAILLTRIRDRIESPTVRKIASIYNFLGARKVTEYGARVQTLCYKRPWEKRGCRV